MPKNKRLTVRLDDVLDSTIQRACENGRCDKSAAVIHALRRGFGIDQDQAEAEEPQTQVIPTATVRQRPTYLINASVPGGKVTGLIMEGKTYKYCVKCNHFYRKDASGNYEILKR